MLAAAHAQDGTPVTQLTSGSEKKVQLMCDLCRAPSVVSWSNYQQSLRTHPDREGKTYCRPCSKKIGGIKQRGKSAPAVAIANKLRSAENSSNWKGGRYLDREGYVLVFVPESKRTGQSKYVKEHILVIQDHVGRQLLPQEVVHHIDNNKENNTVDNLLVLTAETHRAVHVSLTLATMLLRAFGVVPCRTKVTTDLCWSCYYKGLIVFDRTVGVYSAMHTIKGLTCKS